MKLENGSAWFVKIFHTRPQAALGTMLSLNIYPIHFPTIARIVGRLLAQTRHLWNIRIVTIKSRNVILFMIVMNQLWNKLLFTFGVLLCIISLSSSIFPIPGFEFTDPSQLDQFVEKNLGDGRWQCTICKDFSNTGKNHVRNHVESKHFPNTFSYNCPFVQCGKVFYTFQAIQKHKSREHKQW